MRKISTWLKDNILGMVMFAVITGVIGNFVFDWIKTPSRSSSQGRGGTSVVLLVRGEDPEGRPIYAYVDVKMDLLESFMTAQAKGTFYPQEYGNVIASGSGEPDQATREKMEREYNFDHKGMYDIRDAQQAKDLRIFSQMNEK